MNWLARLWKRSDHRNGGGGSTVAALISRRRSGRSVISPRPESDLVRMQRLAQWCVDGRLAAAELELHDWQRHAHCPPAARVLLAALLARRGQIDEALKIIHDEAERQLPGDAASGQMLVALLAAGDMTESSRDLAYQVYQRFGDDPILAQWIHWMQSSVGGPPVCDATAERLAAELRSKPQVIPALLAAQRVSPRQGQVMLLRRSLGLALKQKVDLSVELTLCQALAELALLADDHDDARRWAHRGLKIEPYKASLALLLARINDDAQVGPPAAEVLTGAAARHPEYPDVQATLIRRYQTEGKIDDARRHLAWWLARSPDQPQARNMQKELAA